MQSEDWEARRKKLAPATASASHGVIGAYVIGTYLHAKIQGERRAGSRSGSPLCHAVIATSVPFTPNATRQASLYLSHLAGYGGNFSSLEPLFPI
jgi:hypothetical protein